VRTLLVDNHDSYTFNLFQLLAEVNGADPLVLANDDDALAALDLAGLDNIVVSPGPGHPAVARDLGLVPALLAGTDLPVLGVCLGHQALAWLSGGTVEPAPRPEHGRLARITHRGDELFTGVPAEFVAVRYHSLCVAEPLPPDYLATAWADDGVVMAIRHRDRPRWGVQFHPESVASTFGRELLTNFRDLSATPGHRRRSGPSGSAVRPAPVGYPTAPGPSAGPGEVAGPLQGTAGLRLHRAELPVAVDTEAAFETLFAGSPDCFWLDSSRVEPGLSRFSFLGDVSGPLAEALTYRVGDAGVTVRSAAGSRLEPGTVFDVLRRQLARRRVADAGLPFDFDCGYVGWFGYELKADCGAAAAHRSPMPDSCWIFTDRLVAVDHERGVTHLIALYRDDDGAARAWVTATSARLAALAAARLDAPPAATLDEPAGSACDPVPHLALDRAAYLDRIGECQRELRRGESYEICLTDAARVHYDGDDLALYRRLRRLNPAPYAALLRIGRVCVYGSSPERFLRVTPAGRVETRPIKGTAPRHPDPARDAELAARLAGDAKTRAENLMIVDLLRNDLGQVCRVGSVSVDRYLAVESYQTMHQLVSTVSGQLRPEVDAVDCVRHCFPGGSMTGAPKQRTMEILDRLEPAARGVYSGALGYFGLTGGADLSIVIRTAVRAGDELHVGAGGAIVLDSDPADEFDEMVLKATAPLTAWSHCHPGPGEGRR
jgi:para-aminobenzoate synthetase